MAGISEADVQKLVEIFNREKISSGVDSDGELPDIKKLKRKVEAFLRGPSDFKPGDTVKWKEGLKNKKYPKENQLCIVIDVLPEPIIQDTRDSGSPYYREPLDLILALLDDESELLLFHYDKRRFELVSDT